jgi:hypothetical protein
MLRLLAALPFAHIAVCYLYILSRNAGFQGSIGAISDVSDVFSVSISEIVWFYISTIIAIALTYWLMEKEPQKLLGKDEFSLNPELNAGWLRVFIWVSIIVIPLMQFVIAYFQGKIVLVTTIIIIVPIYYYFSNKLIEANGFRQIYNIPGCWIVTSLAFIFVHGYTDGFNARTLDYGRISDRPFVCSTKSKLMFKTGPYMIVAAPNGSRLGLASDCKEVLRFKQRIATVEIVL